MSRKGDRGFEFRSLQQRVNCELQFRAHSLSTWGAPAGQLSGLRDRVLREDLLHAASSPSSPFGCRVASRLPERVPQHECELALRAVCAERKHFGRGQRARCRRPVSTALSPRGSPGSYVMHFAASGAEAVNRLAGKFSPCWLRFSRTSTYFARGETLAAHCGCRFPSRQPQAR